MFTVCSALLWKCFSHNTMCVISQSMTVWIPSRVAGLTSAF